MYKLILSLIAGVAIFMIIVVIVDTILVEEDRYIFCKECCWYWEQTNTKLFTCAETKEKLWRHVP